MVSDLLDLLDGRAQILAQVLCADLTIQDVENG